MPNEWPVFLCYRKVDARKQAEWLYNQLRGELIPLLEGDDAATEPGGQPPRLRIYWDEETLPGQKWEQVHGDALRSARAFVLICSPGACRVEEKDDWVHKEIDWWAEHRSAAPIIVETTGVGERWIPKKALDHWPGIQWVTITEEWVDSSDIPAEERQRILHRIIAGIASSERSVRNEQIVELERLVARNKHLIVGQWLALALASVALPLAIYFAISANRSAVEAMNRATEVTAANKRAAELLESERAERVKAQYFLALRNGWCLIAVERLAS